MTITVRDIVKGGLRKLQVLPAGREPTGDQAQDALDILQALYKEFVGQGVFGKIYDTIVTGATYTAHENERCVCNRSAGVTITLPDTITTEFPASTTIGFINGYTDYGWGTGFNVTPRTPRDSSIICVTDMFSTLDLTWVYDAPGARWVSLDAITLDTIAPLSGRYGEGLKALLAVRSAPNWNVTPQPSVVAQAHSANSMLSHRYDRPYRPVAGQFF